MKERDPARVARLVACFRWRRGGMRRVVCVGGDDCSPKWRAWTRWKRRSIDKTDSGRGARRARRRRMNRPCVLLQVPRDAIFRPRVMRGGLVVFRVVSAVGGGVRVPPNFGGTRAAPECARRASIRVLCPCSGSFLPEFVPIKVLAKVRTHGAKAVILACGARDDLEARRGSAWKAPGRRRRALVPQTGGEGRRGRERAGGAGRAVG